MDNSVAFHDSSVVMIVNMPSPIAPSEYNFVGNNGGKSSGEIITMTPKSTTGAERTNEAPVEYKHCSPFSRVLCVYELKIDPTMVS